eukprot:Nitzschia sp. Nitz4//scaffold48_size128905//44792//46135//NITZ4_003592-RA/size128905-processed-gene-0.79-mRNA-1//1//CDS//3329552958//8326//frame0
MPSQARQRGGFGLAACGMLGESYFSADGDEDVSKANVAQPLSWRGDPHLTYSDWTIVVVTGEYDSRTYHVHKSALSVGPRSSKYFANLFLEQGPHYHQSQTTRIELDEQDADSFPLMLDFMYNTSKSGSPDDDSLSLDVGDDFNTSNAVSLRHLARVFDCEGLMLAVNKFIQRDLSLKTGPLYLTQAYLYQDERLIESAKRLCLDNFSHLETRTLTRLPLPLFRSIVVSVIQRSKASKDYNKEDETTLSCQLSEVVCQYFEKHPQAMNVKLLLELTNESVMPKISSEPAIGFTALAREIDTRNIPPNSDEWRGLVELCQRCAKAVVGEYGWKDFNVNSALEEYLHGPCAMEKGSKIDSLLFATSFAAALDKAQNDYKAVNRGSSDVKKHVNELQTDNSELRKANRGMKDEVERYKVTLRETKDELMNLKKQVSELRRNQRRSLEELA